MTSYLNIYSFPVLSLYINIINQHYVHAPRTHEHFHLRDLFLSFSLTII